MHACMLMLRVSQAFGQMLMNIEVHTWQQQPQEPQVPQPQAPQPPQQGPQPQQPQQQAPQQQPQQPHATSSSFNGMTLATCSL